METSYSDDVVHEAMLDGNAAAGILSEFFTAEMTACSAECAHCGNVGQIATLLAYMQAPGVILRCPVCGHVILRVVQSPSAFFLDARGAVYISLLRSSA
ncbi:MAG: DUF6510 family protein [Candidatus Promineifilaceae bacterium]